MAFIRTESRYLAFLSLFFICPLSWAALITDPIPLSSQGNLFLDQDGDGRMDAIQLEFVSNVSRSYLDQRFDSVITTWPDSSGHPLYLVSRNTDFLIDSLRPRRLIRLLPSSFPIAPRLTSLSDSNFAFPYGETAYYEFGIPEPHKVRMGEAMPPVITSARLFPATKGSSADTLRITLSEPTLETTNSVDNFLEWRRPDQNDIHPLRGSTMQWRTPSVMQILLPQGSEHPKPGDSLRLVDGSLRDILGNKVQVNSSRFHPVTGLFSFRLETQTKAEFDPNSDEWKRRPVFQIDFLPLGSTMIQADWLGIGMDLGSTDLVATIQGQLQGNRRWELPDPAKARWQAELWIYGVDGQPVHHSQLNVSCANPGFSLLPNTSGTGNCFEYPAKVVLRWNLRAIGGQAVASGAYVARIGNRFIYDGTTIHASYPSSPEGTGFWGVLRRSDGTP